MVRSRVIFIVPAFNEETTIGHVVHSLKSIGDVIVVNDASKDKTVERAESNGATVITNPVNVGYNQSINNGFLYAHENKYEFCITWDADDQFDIACAHHCIEQLRNGYDAVIGYRQKFQRFSEAIFAFLFKFIWNIKDPLCGLKAFNMHAVSAEVLIDRDFSINTDRLLYLIKNNARIFQILVPIKKRVGEPRFGIGLKPNLQILKCLLLSLLLGRVHAK